MDRKIIDYGVIVQGSKELKREVRKIIEAGWQPLGGVQLIAVDETVMFAQAVVKYEDLPDGR